MKLPPLLPLRVFEVASRHSSIRSAAEELNIDHTAVSRHLKSLQSALRIQLIRTTRSGIALTSAGERYAAAVRRALVEINSATADLHRAHHAGSLSIWSRSGFAAYVLTPRLAEFQRLFPSVAVSLRPSEDDPDFSENQADVQIRFGASQAAEVCQVELCRPDIFLLASPGWLECHKPPRNLTELRRCRLINTMDDCWNQWLADHGIAERMETGGPNAWNTHFALEAAKAGQGIALANQLIAQSHLDQGLLRVIDIPLPSAPLRPYMLVAHRDLWGDPAVAGFRRWLTGVLAARREGASPQQAAG